MLRCVGRDWHKADNPTVPAFVGYWTNNGQRSALGLNGSAANDPLAEVGRSNQALAGQQLNFKLNGSPGKMVSYLLPFAGIPTLPGMQCDRIAVPILNVGHPTYCRLPSPKSRIVDAI